MPEYLAPGVFIEEIERGPKPIAGVGTSTAAFLGEAERGPTRPQLVTSYGEYNRLFGDVWDDAKYLPFGVKAFFDNGGRRCFIARIVGPGAATAEASESGYTLKAKGPGAAGDRIWVRVLKSDRAQANPRRDRDGARRVPASGSLFRPRRGLRSVGGG
jgi:uncharacterized protein